MVHFFVAGYFHKRRSYFLGAYNQIGLTHRLPTCGATGAMRKGRFIGRQMIVNHGTDFRNVQASCRKIGADQHIRGAGSEAEERTFACILFHASVIDHSTETFAAQILPYSVCTLTMCHKNNGLRGTFLRKQTGEGL